MNGTALKVLTDLELVMVDGDGKVVALAGEVGPDPDPDPEPAPDPEPVARRPRFART
jgi:hypothetical protein